MGRKSNVAKQGLPEIEGVAIQQDNGGWRGIAEAPSGGQETRGGFITAMAAYSWARDQRAKLAEGMAAGAITLDACLVEYEAQAAEDKLGEAHVRRVRVLVERAVAAGLRNIKAADFRDNFRAWVKGLKSDWCYAEGECPYKIRPLAVSTRRQYATMVATVIDVARSRNSRRFGLPFNPLADVEIGKAPDFHKPTFTVPELRRLVTADCPVALDGSPIHTCEDPWSLLNKALVYTGFRSTLAANLRLEWFDMEADILRFVNTKTKTRGAAYLQPEFKEIVLAEIARRGLKPGEATGWLIEDPELRRTGCINPGQKKKDPAERTSKDSHSAAFQAMLVRFGIDAMSPDGRKRTTHSTRHSFIALHQGRGEADISKIQAWVGHKTRSMTTETYGTEAEEYAYVVRDWPGFRMCLRHAPDSPFHQPAKQAAAISPEMLGMMEELKAMRRLMTKFMDAEAIVIPDADEPIQFPVPKGA